MNHDDPNRCAECGAAFELNANGRPRRWSIFRSNRQGVPVSYYVCPACRDKWYASMQRRPPAPADEDSTPRPLRLRRPPDPGLPVQVTLF